ncbi:HIT domain-containing protein [Alphaproteobacteria bacterium US3C007]|nr:HIT domain-containing protein [Alphaproteobacteria bacterium US3C007]
MTLDLEEYITKRMQMSHIYQPVMLKVLLENSGEASVDQIASALLTYDQSQMEYYGKRTKQMVGKVLTKNGVVEPIRSGRATKGYRLNSEALTEAQRASLIAECDKSISDYLDKRGDRIWQHRASESGYVSGSTRYNVLKRAKYRCELCGAHETQVALHVDHIMPRSKGGPDDLSNFQALCQTCNTNKRAEDDTDFRGILDSYSDRDADCVFCNNCAGRIIAENELCFAIRDGFPVTDLHTLIIPKRHVADFFDLYQPELNAIHDLLSRQRQSIMHEDKTVTGFNVGINAGKSAGQTVFHVHIHLIPRRNGDVEEPRGGIRGVIPRKQSY